MKDTTPEPPSLFGSFAFLLGLYALYVGWSFFTGVVNALEKIEAHMAVIATCSAPPTPEPPAEPEP